MKEYIKKTMKILMIFAILFLVAGAVSASENVTDDDGSVSSSDAEIISAKATGSFTELQNIINKAKKGDTINLNKNYAYSNGDLENGIVISKSISINGNGAVLDGKDTARIFVITEIYDEENYDETGTSVLLKNLAFINGKAEIGGAILVDYGCSLNVSDCEFKNNKAIGIPVKDEIPTTGFGGAIYSSGTLDVKNSRFIQNNATEEGGAIYTGDAEQFNVLNCNFTKNKANSGGAISALYLIASASNFIDNSASSGGAIFSGYYDCKLDIRKSLFKSNQGGSGGAIEFFGTAKISESQFVNNTGMDGGAIFADGDGLKLTIDKTAFINNSASEYGGAIDFGSYNAKTSISNTLFKSNTADSGGSISNALHKIKLTNTTFEDNTNEEVFIKFKAFKTYYKSGKAFKVTVINQITKEPIANAKVALRLIHAAPSKDSSAKTLYATTNSKGIASFKTISKLKPNYYTWGYDMTVKGYGSAWMDLYVISVNIPTLTKAPKVVAKLKASKDFKVTVKNKINKKAVKNCKVKVKVYTGKKYKTYKIKTDKKGVAKLNTKILKKGTHKVEVSSGNYKYTIDAKSTITIK